MTSESKNTVWEKLEAMFDRPVKILGWLSGAMIAAFFFGMFCKSCAYDREKIELDRENDMLNKKVEAYEKRIPSLMHDSALVVDKLKSPDANTNNVPPNNENSDNSVASSPPSSQTVVNHHNTTLTSGAQENDPYYTQLIEEQHKNAKLQAKIDLIGSEKEGLIRAANKYKNKVDSLVNELGFVYNRMQFAEGDSLIVLQKKFKGLVDRLNDENKTFDATEYGKELTRIAKADKEKADSLQQILNRERAQRDSIIQAGSKKVLVTADDWANNARSILSSAENLKNWFNMDKEAKCGLISVVVKSFEKATSMGLDCTQEVQQLKNKYPGCD